MTNEDDITSAKIHKHDLDVMCHAMHSALLENDCGKPTMPDMVTTGITTKELDVVISKVMQQLNKTN